MYFFQKYFNMEIVKINLSFAIINLLIIIIVSSLLPLAILSYNIYPNTIQLYFDIADGVIALILTSVMLISVYFILKKNNRAACIMYIILGIICAAIFLQSFSYKLAHTLPKSPSNLKLAFQKGNLTTTELDFHCCGLNGYKDYEEIKLPIPPSCCSKITVHTCEINELRNVPGCYKATERYMINQSIGITIFMILFILESTGIGLSLYLLRKITNNQTNNQTEISSQNQPQKQKATEHATHNLNVH